MDDPAAKILLPLAADIAADIAEQTDAIWAERYPHKAALRPGLALAEALRNACEEGLDLTASRHAELLQAAKVLISVQRRALREDAADVLTRSAVDAPLRADLDMLHKYMQHLVLSPQGNVADGAAAKIWDGIKEPFRPRYHELPDGPRELMIALEREYAQKPFRPLQMAGAVMSEASEEVKTYARRYPGIFYPIVSATALGTFLMSVQSGVRVSHKEPESTAFIPEFDAEGNLVGGSVDTANINYNMELSCDDHFKMYAPKAAKFLEEHGLDASGFFNWLDGATKDVNIIPHCSKMKDIGFLTEKIASGVYEISKMPMEIAMEATVKGPLQKAGHLAFEQSAYMQGFSAGAETAASHIYVVNAAENAVIHGTMGGVSNGTAALALIALAVALGSGKKSRERVFNAVRDGAAGLRDGVKNVARGMGRLKNMKLDFALAGAAGMWAYDMAVLDKMWDVNIATAAIGGVIAGAAAEKAASVFRNPEKVRALIAPVQGKIDEFSRSAAEFVQGLPAEDSGLSRFRKIATSRAAKAAAVYVGSSFALAAGSMVDGAPDIVAQAAEVKGYMDAYGLAWGIAFPINLVEDTAQHFGVSAVGIATSPVTAVLLAPVLAGAYLARKAKKGLRTAFLSTALAISPASALEQAPPEQGGKMIAAAETRRYDRAQVLPDPRPLVL